MEALREAPPVTKPPAKYTPRAERPVVPIARKAPKAPAPPAPKVPKAIDNPYHQWLERYQLQPVLFVQEVFGVEPDPWQREVLEAYGSRKHRRMSIRSGHGVGKTTVLAWIILHHALTRFPQKTVCTAPTTAQLFDALMAETKAWLKKLPPGLQSMYEVKADRVELVAAPEESFIAFRTSSPEKPEALAGVHSAHVLLVADEASGIPEAIYEAASGSMSGHNALTILAGNPVRTSGLFFDTHNNADIAKMWWLKHVSCHDSPRCTPDFFADMNARYGEGSNAYRVRVLGEFPLAEANVVIPYENLQAALTRDVRPQVVHAIWGLDCGESQDPSALAKRKGNVLEEKTKEFRCEDEIMRAVAWVKGEWDATPKIERPSEINVDSIGIGSGVASRLRELGLPARSINVSETAPMKEQFMRLRDELWWKGREWFAKRDCNIAGDEKLAAELGRPTYEPQPNGKTKVEAKKDTKKRTKTRSPNRADAFLLTLASDAITAAGTDPAPTSWSQAQERDLGMVA